MIRIGISTIFFIIAIGSQQIEALRCFSCSYTTTSGDEKCVTDPESIGGQNIITCSKKYCTIIRQELQDPKGKVATFSRGCEEVPLFLNDVIEDDTHISYYRSCTSDLCNRDDGTSSSGSLIGSDAGAGDNLLVPGLRGNSIGLIINTVLMTNMLLLIKFMNF